MSDTSLLPPERHNTAHLMLGLVGLCLIAAAFFAPVRAASLALSAAGSSALFVVLFTRLMGRKAEKHVAGLKAQVKALIEDDPASVLACDRAGHICVQNAAARALLGEGHETIDIALSVLLSTPAQSVARLGLKARETKSAQEDIQTRKGYVRLSCTRLRSDCFIWRIDDLPAPKTEASHAALSAIPMLMIGRNDTVLYMNDEARDFLGARSKTLEEIFPQLPLRLNHLQTAQTAKGRQKCLVIEAARKGGRQELLLIPTAQDIVELPENARFFDELPVPLLKLLPDGEVISSNRMARELLGHTDVEGASLGDLLEGLGRSIHDWLQETVNGRASRQSEFLKVRRADIEAFVQVILKPAVEDGQNVLVAVLNDATELKTLEAQFVQSQKMQAIGQLAGGVAHDFNNLLTAITGHCDLLMLKRDEADSDYADLEQINQNANRAAALVSQLLAFSRKQTLRPEVIDIEETLSDLTHLLNRLVGETIDLEFSHATGNACIRADKRQIEQVVMNLVVNARDAMPRGGTIRIRTELLDLTCALKRDRAEVPAGQYVSVKVIDEGSGIPKDKLQKIFEPFFTTKRTGEGTGLGLSTAYGIVKQTGGFIFADSTVGRGSCFSLLFPIHLETERLVAATLENAASEAEKPAPDALVLLVEDEAPVRAFAARALKLKGFTVIEATCGEEALEILADDALHVDVFVTDVIMPGLKGPEWVKKAKEARPNVSVVFVSGYAEDVFRDDGPNIDGASFLQKPFSLVELAEVVQRAVSSQTITQQDLPKA